MVCPRGDALPARAHSRARRDRGFARRARSNRRALPCAPSGTALPAPAARSSRKCAKFRVALDLRPQVSMKAQRHVGVFRRVFGRAIERNFVERNPARAPARHRVVADRRQVQVAACEAVEIVRLVRFEHVRFEHRVVRAAAQFDPMIGERMLRVLEVLPELGARCVAEPWRQRGQHLVPIRVGQVRPRIGGQPGCSTARRLDRERKANDLARSSDRRSSWMSNETRSASPIARSHCRALPASAPFRSGRGAHSRRAPPLGRRRRTLRRFGGRVACATKITIAARSLLQPYLELEPLVQRAQPLGRRLAQHQVDRRRRQLAIALDRQQPLAFRQPRERARRFSPTTPGISPACAITLVERSVLRRSTWRRSSDPPSARPARCRSRRR